MMMVETEKPLKKESNRRRRQKKRIKTMNCANFYYNYRLD